MTLYVEVIECYDFFETFLSKEKKLKSNLAATPDLVEDLGCWTDKNNRVMSSLEDHHAAHTENKKRGRSLMRNV